MPKQAKKRGVNYTTQAQRQDTAGRTMMKAAAGALEAMRGSPAHTKETEARVRSAQEKVKKGREAERSAASRNGKEGKTMTFSTAEIDRIHQARKKEAERRRRVKKSTHVNDTARGEIHRGMAKRGDKGEMKKHYESELVRHGHRLKRTK